MTIKEKENQKAIANLKRLHDIIIKEDSVDQTNLNFTADYLRKYLGEHSRIYSSFWQIDINKETRSKEIVEAAKLIRTAIEFIELNGVYKDLQLEILELQAKELRNKFKFAFWGAIGAFILALITALVTIYIKDIFLIVKS